LPDVKEVWIFSIYSLQNLINLKCHVKLCNGLRVLWDGQMEVGLESRVDGFTDMEMQTANLQLCKGPLKC